MSQQLINRSPDLKRLRDEGYNIEVRQSGHLLVKDVPYVNSNKEVKTGILVSTLNLAGNVTAAPDTHVAMFIGEYPCEGNGAPLEQIRHSGRQELAPGLVVDHSFSAKPKPKDRYDDYYDKVTAYVAIFLTHAHVINPEATAQTFPVITTEEGESVFKYIDTATSRAGITLPTQKLELAKVAIVGVGGTGSYVLDLVAKTPVKEIHLFDGDIFLSHNAFRAPSAASVDELVTKHKKVAYWTEMYSKMRRGIVAHPYHVDESNVAELQTMDFVFLCVDAAAAKKTIVESLETFGRRFVDVGMGVELVDDALRGVLRVTTSTPDSRDHFRTRVSLAEANINDDYDSNIQVADLNALNAALAVIRWKKLCGFYFDFEHEHHSTYSIDCGMLTNDDQNEKAIAQT
jgi:tRNA A37 threonylcarbamoyladenosine dehydratase